MRDHLCSDGASDESPDLHVREHLRLQRHDQEHHQEVGQGGGGNMWQAADDDLCASLLNQFEWVLYWKVQFNPTWHHVA